MPQNPYTNVRRTTVLAVTTSRKAVPHVATQYANKVMPLTDKEKKARLQNKTATGNKAANYSLSSGLSGNTALSGQTNFFSVQMGPDFLEQPQSLREKREIYRHWYNRDPIVAQALDLHTELPLSKVRLAPPKPISCPKGFESPEDYGRYILSFFERMCDNIKLFQKLITIVHHYWLDGTVSCFAEDSDVEVPENVGYTSTYVTESHVTDEGEAVEAQKEVFVESPTKDDEELAYYRKHYKGWGRIIIFPIDQIKITSMNYSDKVRLELIPSDRDKALIEQAKNGDEGAMEMIAEIPEEVLAHISEGKLIPLGTDPDEGSFCYLLSARKGAGEELGQSLLDRCLNVLTYREKLRQAQTMIASRAMTPKRIVWAEGLSAADVDELREQVDLALVDPDYSIVVNYELHWEEMGSRDRLLDLSAEYEQTERQLRTGLGVTESLLSGESLYSGDRLKLEVINQRYLFLREILQEYVEKYLFKPVAIRKGFVEKDKWGDEVVLYPKLSFTRLPLRDSQDTYDALFNLYQKGSLDIGTILELFNLDADEIRQKIERDMFTVNDPNFNEILRGAYGALGQELVTKTDLQTKMAEYLGLKPQAEPESQETRFG